MPGTKEFYRLGRGLILGPKGLGGDIHLPGAAAVVLALAAVATGAAGAAHLPGALATGPQSRFPETAAPAPLRYGPPLPPPADVATARLVNVNSGERATFEIPKDGLLDRQSAPAYAAQIDRFFRCWRTGQVHPMSPQVLAMLAELAEQYAGRTIEIVSGYRAYPFSSSTSRHRHGRAIDLRVEGVPMEEVRDYLWSTHAHEVGVGYYQEEQFVHIDYRAGHEAVAWTQTRRNASYTYHPLWAVKIRRALARLHHDDHDDREDDESVR